MSDTNSAVCTTDPRSVAMPPGGIGTGRFMPPEELAMQSLTKQLYKSRLFRGVYLERCFVEQLGGYRDVVALQCSERDLEKQLLATTTQLQMFYQRFVPNMWVGITKGSVGTHKHTSSPYQLDTCVWTELNDLAFGEYWFSIKSLRFRSNEVQFKLKMIREVEPDTLLTSRRSLPLKKSSPRKSLGAGDGPAVADGATVCEDQTPAVGFSDFVDVLQQWRHSTITTIYEFMANDVNKRNIMSTIRFLGLLLFSLVSGTAIALRFIGIFALRFLFELSRFTHTATPIVFKLIEFVNKIVGAFFILLTMIWKDLVVNRGGQVVPKQQLESNNRFKSITYGRSESHRRPYEATNFR